MSPTQYTKLSVILMSLIYFLPIISILMLQSDPQNTADPVLISICFTLVMLVLLLPGFASFLYTRFLPETNWKIHLPLAAILFAGIFFLWGAGSNFRPEFLQMALANLLPYLMPFVLLFMIPVWSQIAYAKESQKFLKLFGVLAAILYFIPILMILLLPDCPVGETPAYTYTDARMVLFGTGLFSIVTGVVLAYLGLTHPEMEKA